MPTPEQWLGHARERLAEEWPGLAETAPAYFESWAQVVALIWLIQQHPIYHGAPLPQQLQLTPKTEQPSQPQPCLTSPSGTPALAPMAKELAPAESAPTKQVSSANMVSISAVNASEKKPQTLDSLSIDEQRRLFPNLPPLLPKST